MIFGTSYFMARDRANNGIKPMTAADRVINVLLLIAVVAGAVLFTLLLR